MSDLTATGCGCGCDTRDNGGFSSCLWIIILLFCCGGCGNGSSGLFGYGRDGCGDNSCIWIIILLLCCGGCGN